MNVFPFRWSTSAPSLTAPPTVSQPYVGVDRIRRVPLAVHGFDSGRMNIGCEPL